MTHISMLSRLEGTQTIDSIMALLKVKRQKAVYIIHRLRKEGYVKTKKRSDQTRVYEISFKNKLKGTDYYEIINSCSPVKISAPNQYNIFGKKPTIEETIVFAINTKSLRTILASLSLFRKIEDWHKLYLLSKKSNIQQKIGALYDLSRLVIKKVQRMPNRFRNNALPKSGPQYQYIIDGLRSMDFQNIEKTWKIYIPFNKQDLEDYHDFH